IAAITIARQGPSPRWSVGRSNPSRRNRRNVSSPTARRFGCRPSPFASTNLRQRGQVWCLVQWDWPSSCVWRVAGDAERRRLHVRWHETGGPRVKAPARKGFGSLLIQTTGEADTRIDFHPRGLKCLLDLSL